MPPEPEFEERLKLIAGWAAYALWDYRTHPALYAAQSAPWYAGILVHAALAASILLSAFVVKVIVRRQMLASVFSD